MNNRRFYATTTDNPFNPFINFNEWFLFDCEKGYYTCNRVARLTKVTDDMTEKEEQLEVERAIERLIEIDPLDIYIKVYRPNSKTSKNEEKKAVAQS